MFQNGSKLPGQTIFIIQKRLFCIKSKECKIVSYPPFHESASQVKVSVLEIYAKKRSKNKPHVSMPPKQS